jgi:hypothetical protein
MKPRAARLESNMSTIVELTEQQLAELQQLTNQNDASTAIQTALAEYLRYVRRTQLKALSGRVEMEDSWRALEEAEGNSDHANSGPGAD